MNLLSLTYQEFERLLKAFTIVTVLLTVLVALIRWLGLGTPIATAAWVSQEPPVSPPVGARPAREIGGVSTAS